MKILIMKCCICYESIKMRNYNYWYKIFLYEKFIQYWNPQLNECFLCGRFFVHEKCIKYWGLELNDCFLCRGINENIDIDPNCNLFILFWQVMPISFMCLIFIFIN